MEGIGRGAVVYVQFFIMRAVRVVTDIPEHDSSLIGVSTSTTGRVRYVKRHQVVEVILPAPDIVT